MAPKQRSLACLQIAIPIRLHSFVTISSTLRAKCQSPVLKPWKAVFFYRSLNTRRIFSDWASQFQNYPLLIQCVFQGDGNKTEKPNFRIAEPEKGTKLRSLIQVYWSSQFFYSNAEFQNRLPRKWHQNNEAWHVYKMLSRLSSTVSWPSPQLYERNAGAQFWNPERQFFSIGAWTRVEFSAIGLRSFKITPRWSSVFFKEMVTKQWSPRILTNHCPDWAPQFHDHLLNFYEWNRRKQSKTTKPSTSKGTTKSRGTPKFDWALQF